MSTLPNAFAPEVAKTVKIAATTSNAQGTIQVAFGQVRVYNAGPNTAFFRTGVGAQTAAVASDMPIPAGAVETFSINPGHTGAAAICETGTASVYVTSGVGF